jgi:NAD(P)-dependent dehydrogenase (short-subunit alcohol dehydrogenase family)
VTSGSRRPLDGRVALVTGGASGIGRACALELAAAGAAVAIGSRTAPAALSRPAVENTYYPTDDELAAARHEIEALGVGVYAAPLELRDDASVDALLAGAAKQLGPVDIVVTAAGVDASEPMAGHDDDLWHKVIDTNLHGNYRVLRRVLPGMMARGRGRIVIIGSTSAKVGAAGQAAYAASKAGLLGLMRCVALEAAPHGVTCNAVSPATVDTDMMRTSFAHKIEKAGNVTWEALWKRALEGYPQGHFLEPQDVAAMVGFLCREEARGITGENVGVTGGALY